MTIYFVAVYITKTFLTILFYLISLSYISSVDNSEKYIDIPAVFSFHRYVTLPAWIAPYGLHN